jgi:hypothetical protein
MTDEDDSSSSVAVIKELVPGLDNEVIQNLLFENDCDLNRSLDAAFTYNRILEIEKEGSQARSDQETTDASSPGSSSLTSESRYQSSDRITSSRSSSKTNRRGTVIPLPPDFLYIPKFRVLYYKKTKIKIEYTIIYRRKKNKEKLGMSIDTGDGIVKVVGLLNGYLADLSGVQQGDLIVGINDYLFGPYPDHHDLLNLLVLSDFATSAPSIKVNYCRMLISESERRDKFLHSFVKYFYKEQRIDDNQIILVNIALSALKNKVLRWNRRLDIGRACQAYLEEICLKREGYFILDDVTNLIRPALTARILKSEILTYAGSQTTNGNIKEIYYMIWVADIESEIEWITKKKYEDFYELHQVFFSRFF